MDPSVNTASASAVSPQRIVIATRESRLALWQAEHVRSLLQKLYPACNVDLLGMTTRGDQILDRARIGLYMGVFNLSIVLPQLVVSLGVGTFISRVEDKGAIFLIGAVSLALAAIAWRSVSGEQNSGSAAVTASGPH